MTVEAPTRDEAVVLAVHRARRSHGIPTAIKAAQQLGAVWRVIVTVAEPATTSH